MSRLRRIIHEIHRRSLWQVLAIYVGASLGVIEVADVLIDRLALPSWIYGFTIILLLIGLPIVLATAFVQEGMAFDRSEPKAPGTGPEKGTEVSPTARRGKSLQRLLTWRNAITGGVLALALWGLVAAGWLVLTDRNGAADQDVASVTSQLLEIDRLRDRGHYDSAFALASQVESFLPADTAVPDLWAEISWSADIETDPPGARVYRQRVDAPEDEWELLGTTPLRTVRFAEDAGYRLRFELEGHRPVELLQTAIRGVEWRGAEPLNPVKLDSVDVLPEGMVRIPGFTHDLVDYGDYFMDRYEVTNREYKRFVAAGGYEKPEYWVEPFVRDGEEIPWEEAVGELVDRTGRPGPSTWRVGTYPDGRGDYPVSGVSWYEAAAYARFVGKELPTSAHWNRALRFFRENSWLITPRSNLGGDGPRPVGENQAMSTLGVYDLVGNVREWCWNEAGEDGRATRGGAWTDAPYLAGWIIPKSPWARGPTHSFRLVQTFDDDEKLARLREPVKPRDRRNYSKEEAASEAEYRIYERLYAYDPLPLDAEVEAVDTLEHWVREQVSFDLPYGERGGAFLYLPKEGDPPFESVLFWPGHNVLFWYSAEDVHVDAFDFLLRSGRAVVLPIFKRAFFRDGRTSMASIISLLSDPQGTRLREHRIKWIQDLSRTIDYLETREDIDTDRLGYYGISWGGGMAPIVLALEDRIDAAVLNGAGLGNSRYLPEIDPFNFLTRVRTPVLMLNGEYDIVFPLETSQEPMFELLGTEPKHKKHYIAPASHTVARDDLIRETLDWFEHYLEEGRGPS